MLASWTECLYANRADHTAVSSFTSEASLLAGTNTQPVFPPGFFFDGNRPGKTIQVYASGILACTGTPTYTFYLRIGSTVGSSYLSGTAVLVSAAITCASGISDKRWELYGRITVRTPGLSTSNTTMSASGIVFSHGGFASPYTYALSPGGGESATWTSTLDASVQHYLNLSVACSASSASNTITCKELVVSALN